MKALQFVKYGEPSTETLQFNKVPTPTKANLNSDEVLVKVKAASCNPFDNKLLEGKLKQFMPIAEHGGVGFDLAGIVEAVGGANSKFKVGDEVYGRLVHAGALQEYVITPAKYISPKPRNLSFEEAAAVPLVALSAQLLIFDRANVTKDNVKTALVTAGLGGVGYIAAQILANVVGVERVITTVSTGKVEKVKQLLPNVEVIDYKKKDFGKELKDSVDFIFDTTAELAKEAVAIKPSTNSQFRSLTASHSGSMIDSILDKKLPFYVRYLLNGLDWWDSRGFTKQGVNYESLVLFAHSNDLTHVTEWIETGKVKVLLDSVYEFDQAIEAYKHLKKGGVSGKVVVRIS